MNYYHLHLQPHTWFFVRVCNTALGGIDLKWLTASSIHIPLPHVSMGFCCLQQILPLIKVCGYGEITKTIKTAKHTFFSPVFARGLGVSWCVSAHGPLAFCGTILTFIVHSRIIPLCSRGAIALQVQLSSNCWGSRKTFAYHGKLTAKVLRRRVGI